MAVARSGCEAGVSGCVLIYLVFRITCAKFDTKFRRVSKPA